MRISVIRSLSRVRSHFWSSGFSSNCVVVAHGTGESNDRAERWCYSDGYGDKISGTRQRFWGLLTNGIPWSHLSFCRCRARQVESGADQSCPASFHFPFYLQTPQTTREHLPGRRQIHPFHPFHQHILIAWCLQPRRHLRLAHRIQDPDATAIHLCGAKATKSPALRSQYSGRAALEAQFALRNQPGLVERQCVRSA